MVGPGYPMAWTHALPLTSWDGHVEDLGVLGLTDLSGNPAYEDYSIALAAIDEYAVVVGYAGYQPLTDAFIWTPETKMVKLSAYLTSNGITGHEIWSLVNKNHGTLCSFSRGTAGSTALCPRYVPTFHFDSTMRNRSG
jgi:hypothetical protein